MAFRAALVCWGGAGWLAAMGGWLAGPATAAPAPAALAPAVAADPVRALAPRQRLAQVRALVAQQASGRRSAASGLDITPPHLTSFSVAASVDVTVATHQLQVQMTLVDDLSGVDWAQLHATSPTGQEVWAEVPHVKGTKRHEARTGLHFSPFAEAGIWQVSEVIGRDLAGNFFFYNQGQLAGLGSTSFEVVNAQSDLLAPTLTGGKVLTGSVSLSRPAKGTLAEWPLLRLQLRVADTGSPSASGASNANVFMCLADGSSCFNLQSDLSTLYSLGQDTLYAHGRLTPDILPGLYLIRAVDLFDHAGNARVYLSTAFGGSTDFDDLLSSSTVEVKP